VCFVAVCSSGDPRHYEVPIALKDFLAVCAAHPRNAERSAPFPTYVIELVACRDSALTSHIRQGKRRAERARPRNVSLVAIVLRQVVAKEDRFPVALTEVTAEDLDTHNRLVIFIHVDADCVLACSTLGAFTEGLILRASADNCRFASITDESDHDVGGGREGRKEGCQRKVQRKKDGKSCTF